MADVLMDFEKVSAAIEFAVRRNLDRGLDKAANKLVEALQENSPSSNNSKVKKFKHSWKVNRKYKNVRYVGNTKTVKGSKSENIPLSNILEYDKVKGGFIRRTYDNLEPELIDIVLNELK